MNRTEKIIVAILGVLLCYSFFSNINEASAQREENAKAAAASKQQTAAQSSSASSADEPEIKSAPDDDSSETESQDELASDDEVSPEKKEPVEVLPERREVLKNDQIVVTFTSKGGAIASVELLGDKYLKTLNPEDGQVRFDFVPAQADESSLYQKRSEFSLPTLAIENIPGLDANSDFELTPLPGGKAIKISGESTVAGLKIERTIWITNGFHITAQDKFISLADGQPVSVPAHAIALGSLQAISPDGTRMAGGPGAAVRFIAPDGSSDTLEQSLTESFGNGMPTLAGMFNTTAGGCSSASVSAHVPLNAQTDTKTDFSGKVEWAAVHGRFFAQIFTPSVPGAALRTRATRKPTAGSDSTLEINSVGASFSFPELSAKEPETTVSYYLYIGPRKMSELRSENRAGHGTGYSDLMQYGIWGGLCRLLLDILNGLHSVIPNYGIAIILLTIIIRLILWPLNKRSQESMRKMADLQPKIKALQEKYKDDRQKLQAEQMKLYSEAHVNPLASCLPMLLQMPILIAFFWMLGSCVELRHESFLWVRDLSEPENLLKETLGLGFGINLLPLAMAATMAIQSRLMPSAGDPSQQKMMSWFMPLMMLLICYNYASALSLYWSVSQALGIWAQWRTRRKNGSRRSITQADGTEVIPPERETRQMRRSRERNA